MLVTLDAIVILVRLSHSANAVAPMVVTLDGILYCVSFLPAG
jgi:hypothetical protein